MLILGVSKEEKYKYAVVQVGAWASEGRKLWGGYGKTHQCEQLTAHRVWEVQDRCVGSCAAELRLSFEGVADKAYHQLKTVILHIFLKKVFSSIKEKYHSDVKIYKVLEESFIFFCGYIFLN